MVELALLDEPCEGAHLVLDRDSSIDAGTLEVVEVFCATEFGVYSVHALSEVLGTEEKGIRGKNTE